MTPDTANVNRTGRTCVAQLRRDKVGDEIARLLVVVGLDTPV